MKKLITILFLFVSPRLFAPGYTVGYIAEGTKIDPYSKYWKAVCIVESHNNARIINPLENAYGISQIRWRKLEDYNKSHGTNYTLKNCLDSAFSRKVFYWHMSQYKNETVAVMRWNGKGKKAVEYWIKIKKHL